MAKNIKVDITNKERIYIDGATGERLTPEQFKARHSRSAALNVGKGREDTGAEAGDEETTGTEA